MTSFAPISDIIVPEKRQRRLFDPGELNDLRESIEKHGLWHPPVCRREGEDIVLVSGERRLRAVTDLYELGGVLLFGVDDSGIKGTAPYGTIPYLDVGELGEIERREAELEENIRRKDLTWQERAIATADLAELRTMQAKEKGLRPPTITELTEEVRPNASKGSKGSPQTATSQELMVARHLGLEEVGKAKSLEDAVKILRRREEVKRNEEAGAALTSGRVASGHTLIHTNSIEWMKGQAGGQFDVILTDPMYGMGADTFGDSGGHAGSGGAGSHFYDDSEENFKSTMVHFVPQSYRLTKEQAHLYMFCDLEKFPWLVLQLAREGWKVFRTPILWVAPGKFRAPWPEHGPRRTYECCLFAVKGERKVLKIAPDVITCPVDTNLGHQAQKPVAVFEDLLKRSIRPGERVLDPFCGSGPIFPAAQAVKAFATGVDLDQAACGIAAGRLEKLRSSAC